MELKLADFGLATKMSDSIDERTGERKLLTVICGTPTYVAAEVLSLVGSVKENEREREIYR